MSWVCFLSAQNIIYNQRSTLKSYVAKKLKKKKNNWKSHLIVFNFVHASSTLLSKFNKQLFLYFIQFGGQFR